MWRSSSDCPGRGARGAGRGPRCDGDDFLLRPDMADSTMRGPTGEGVRWGSRQKASAVPTGSTVASPTARRRPSPTKSAENRSPAQSNQRAERVSAPCTNGVSGINTGRPSNLAGLQFPVTWGRPSLRKMRTSRCRCNDECQAPSMMTARFARLDSRLGAQCGRVRCKADLADRLCQPCLNRSSSLFRVRVRG